MLFVLVGINQRKKPRTLALPAAFLRYFDFVNFITPQADLFDKGNSNNNTKNIIGTAGSSF
jgi:hypothetical protein